MADSTDRLLSASSTHSLEAGWSSDFHPHFTGEDVCLADFMPQVPQGWPLPKYPNGDELPMDVDQSALWFEGLNASMHPGEPSFLPETKLITPRSAAVPSDANIITMNMSEQAVEPSPSPDNVEQYSGKPRVQKNTCKHTSKHSNDPAASEGRRGDLAASDNEASHVSWSSEVDHVDMTSPRERNREAAWKSRCRKRNNIEELQKREEDARGTHAMLADEASQLQEQALQLKNEILDHSGCNCSHINKYIQQAAANWVSHESTGKPSSNSSASTEQ